MHLPRLGFVSQWQVSSAKDVDPRLLPCIFLPEDDQWFVLTITDGGELQVIDNGTSREPTEEELEATGTAFFISTEN